MSLGPHGLVVTGLAKVDNRRLEFLFQLVNYKYRFSPVFILAYCMLNVDG